MYYFNRLSPNNFALLASFLGVLLTSILNIDEQNAIGNFFAALGQALNTSVAQAANIEARCEMIKQVEELSDQLEKLKKQLR